MNIYTITRYLNYVFFSSHKRGHGIHSPFVFYLITRVFRNKFNPDVVFNIEKMRQMMIADNRLINVTDYTSGPEKMKCSLRKVSEIAKHTAIPRKYGVLLAGLSGAFGKPAIIEMGTSLGISALYLAAASPDVTVHTMEECPELSGLAKDNFNRSGLMNIRLYNGKFDEMLAEIGNSNIKPGLVFIDGDHIKENVMKYFYEIADICNDKSVIVVNDIHTSAEMGDAWEEIKKYNKVTLTVDIFRMGLIFFREGMSRSDYIIRY